MPISGYTAGGSGSNGRSVEDPRLGTVGTGSLSGKSLAAGLRPSNAASATTLAGAAKSAADTPYECAPGYELTRESTGSGFWVCRNKSTGREIPVQLKGSGGSGGATGGGTNAGAGAASGTGNVTQGNSSYLTAGADIFARNPQAMLADILERTHPDDNGGLGIYHMLAPYGDAANVIFLGQTGQDASGGTKEDFLDWLENDYWQALQTPGASIDVQSVINNALAPAANSPLAAYLAVGSPEQQARNFQNLLAGAYQVGYHPLIADAMNYRLNYAANEFLGEAARGEVDPFYQWIQGSMPNFNRAY
jgi:hypothetical protein